MANLFFVNVAGFLGSGSSAVVDLLKEFEDFYECDAEIRFIKDPHGLVDLESALVTHWELVNSAAAIADFREMCRKGCRNGKHLLSRAGMGYANSICPNFMEITDQYIEKLTDFTYIGDYYHFKFKKNYFKYLIDRYRTGIEVYSKGRFKTGNRNLKPLHFSFPSQQKFNEATQWYMESLFHTHADGKGSPCIILDQAVSVNNTQVIHRYFKKCKMIIVDRDPRDTFVNELNTGCYLGDDYNSVDGGLHYVLQQRALRNSMILDDDILYIKFEDLIINYEETKCKIANFLGVPLPKHILPKKYLKPEESIRNIGLWKKNYEKCKNVIDIIEKELPDLCYNL